MEGKFLVERDWMPRGKAKYTANRIHCIKDWSARICDKGGGPRIVPASSLRDLGMTAEEFARAHPESLMDLARGGTMAYLFFVKALKSFDPELYSWWGTEFVDKVKKLTGLEELNYIEEPQVTMYSSGCFLGQHSDGVGNRRIAFIANFTEDWQPDFGGCLTVHDGQNWVVLEPHFNSLILMDVRAGCGHYVSQVASWVQHNRIAITGWVGRR